MKTLSRNLLVAAGFVALGARVALGGGELAVNTATISYDFPVERVQALVHLYSEGRGQEAIAVPILAKLGEPAHTELMSMKRAAKSADEAGTISEIVNVCFEGRQPPAIASAPESVAAKPRRAAKEVEVRRALPVLKAGAESPAAGSKIASKKSPQIAPGVTGLVNPLMPSATRF